MCERERADFMCHERRQLTAQTHHTDTRHSKTHPTHSHIHFSISYALGGAAKVLAVGFATRRPRDVVGARETQRRYRRKDARHRPLLIPQRQRVP